MPKLIRLGHIALSFHQASAAVIAELLEEAGYSVELSAAPHATMFERLGEGAIDGLVSAWLPASHGMYLEPIEAKVAKLGVLYAPYCIWGVPEYVPQEAVSSIDDLIRPDVARRMGKLIQGINPGAGISRFSAAMIDAYGLGAAGYHFRPGTEEECFGRYEAAVAAGDWCVVPLWHPHWLHHKYRIRALVEPKGMLGGVDQATLVMRDDVVAGMSRALVEILRTITIGNSGVAELDHRITQEGLDPRKAARDWLELARLV